MEEQNAVLTTGTVRDNKTISGRSTGKSCLTALLIAVAAIAVLVFVFILVLDPHSKAVHIGDRVKGSITVTLDGEPVKIKELHCSGEGVGWLKRSYKGNTVKYSMRGNKCTVYEYTCSIGADLPEIRICYDHFNWWEESDTDIVIKISSADDGSYSFRASVSHKYLTEENTWENTVKHISGVEKECVISLGFGA